MSEIADMAYMEINDQLEKVHMVERDVVDSRIHVDERQDMFELLAVVLAPEEDTLSKLGISPHDKRCRELGLWMDSCHEPTPLSCFPLMGVVIAVIACGHQLFTYLNVLVT